MTISRNTVLAFVCSSLTPAALAGEVIVVKANSSGFTMAEWVRTERCEVSTDKVVTTRTFGGGGVPNFTHTEERAITISAGVVQAIASAAAETLQEEPNGLC